ncbi:hypothetical protein PR003_g17133 [Phytophthora rubi]|uniref:Uncharacterized protein n=1 Tax=Phytophthora rubi TaxID=129364 RepID=A0A6A4EJF1_9STRA|nr:hypothetical protein PR003_g17133 [Phytophthora rubi]
MATCSPHSAERYVCPALATVELVEELQPHDRVVLKTMVKFRVAFESSSSLTGAARYASYR